MLTIALTYVVGSTCVIERSAGGLLLNRQQVFVSNCPDPCQFHGLCIIRIGFAVIMNRHLWKHVNAIKRLTITKPHVICRMISYPYNRYFCSDLPLSNIGARRKNVEEYIF